MAHEPHDIEAAVTFFRPQEGGRNKPIFSGFRPTFIYDGQWWCASLWFDGPAFLPDGKTVYVPGLLAFREGPARIIGAVARTREKTKPLYISPGHLMAIDQTVVFVLACCRGYRSPEPMGWAHKVGAGAQLPVDGGM